MPEERGTYRTGIDDLLEELDAERAEYERSRYHLAEAIRRLHEAWDEMLVRLDPAGVGAALESLAAELAYQRGVACNLHLEMQEKKMSYAAAELVFRSRWRRSDAAQEPDPVTGKRNVTWAKAQENLAVLDAGNLSELRAELQEAEQGYRLAQADVEGLQDQFSALRHRARLVSAELMFLAAAPGLGGGGRNG